VIAATGGAARVRLAGGRTLDLRAPVVMGILNVTPDSFSDGGDYADPDRAVARALELEAAGAAIVDVGGESTRPGATDVPADEELRRVLPVIEGAIAAGLAAPISIDTRKARVAREALAAGAALVNDVSGLADPDLAPAAAAAGAGLVIGHMQGAPADMQRAPRYPGGVVEAVEAALGRAVGQARAAGVAAEALLVDPGIGFGKTLEHNLDLLARLDRFAGLAPVVVGLSRKRLLGALTGGRPARERLAAGLGGAVWSALRGARVVRTHDVRATVEALGVAWAIRARLGGEEGPRVA